MGKGCSNVHELRAGRWENGINLIEKEQDVYSPPQVRSGRTLLQIEHHSALLSLGCLCVSRDEHIYTSAHFPNNSPPPAPATCTAFLCLLKEFCSWKTSCRVIYHWLILQLPKEKKIVHY